MSAPAHELAQIVRRNHGTWRGWVRHLLALGELGLGRLADHVPADVSTPSRLVFVCLGNINRSAFACAVARSLGEPAVSIGLSTTTGAPATPQAVKVAGDRGLDLGEHRATDFKDHRVAGSDLYLVMEVRHARRLIALGVPARSIAFLGLWAHPARLHLHDPHTLSDDYFRTCFALIDSAVRSLVVSRQGPPS